MELISNHNMLSLSGTPLKDRNEVCVVNTTGDLNSNGYCVAKTMEQPFCLQVLDLPYYWLCMWLKDTRIYKKIGGKQLSSEVSAYTINTHKPGLSFEFQLLEETEALHVFLLPKLMQEVALEQGFIGELNDFQEAFGQQSTCLSFLLRSIKHTLIDNQNHSTILAEHLIRGLCSELLVRYTHHFEGLTSQQSNDYRFSSRQIRLINDYIDGALSEGPDINKLATLCSVGRTTFGSRFKSTFGASPHQYIIKKRIERAKALLNEQILSNLDIAHTCGFADQAHFATLFKRQVGMSPLKYKQLVSGMQLVS